MLRHPLFREGQEIGRDFAFDAARFWRDLQDLGAIGRSETGEITRIPGQKAHRAAIAFVAELLAEIGATVWQDSVGNLFGRLEGRDATAPAVMIGSHLDTVEGGGAFDGALGVVAGVAVLRALAGLGRPPRRPVELVAFADSEGQRFGIHLFGSRAVTGSIEPESLASRRDRRGRPLLQALANAGLTEEALRAAVRTRPLAAYLELHIEEGASLETAGVPLGVATCLAGCVGFHIAVREDGASGRGGPPAAAARMMTVTADVVRKVAGDERDLIQVALDSTNVVPGEVRWALTLHHAEEAMLRRLSEALAAELAALARHHGVLLQVQEVDRIAPAAADAFLQARLERALHAVGAPALALPSPVPSDANAMARIAPVGLLLVRARHGIVHHPDERVRQDDALLAVAGLLRAVRGLVGP